MANLAPQTRSAIWLMSLEQDIHQKDFRSEYHKAVLNLMYTHNYLLDGMNGVFKKHDITRQQYNVLRILRGQHPGHASINLIKDRMIDKMPDTSRIVERLRLKGYLTRIYCATDKRSVEVTITQEGLDALTRMQDEVIAIENLLNALTEDETRQLNMLLEKVRARKAHPQTSAAASDTPSDEKILLL